MRKSLRLSDLDDDTRSLARQAARREGVPLREWLNDTVYEYAAEQFDDGVPHAHDAYYGGRRPRDHAAYARSDRYERSNNPQYNPAPYHHQDDLADLASTVTRLARTIDERDHLARSNIALLSERLDMLDHRHDRSMPHGTQTGRPTHEPSRARQEHHDAIDRAADLNQVADYVDHLQGRMNDADSAARQVIEGLEDRARRLSGQTTTEPPREQSNERTDETLATIMQAINGLQGRFDALETSKQQADQHSAGQHASQYDALREQLDDLHARTDQATSSRLDRLNDSLNQLENRFDGLSQQGSSLAHSTERQLDRLGSQLQSVNETVTDSTMRPGPSALDRLDDAIAEIAARQANLEAGMVDTDHMTSALKGQQAQRFDRLEEQFSSLANKLDALNQHDPYSQQIASLQQDIQAVHQAISANRSPNWQNAMQASIQKEFQTLSQRLEALAAAGADDRQLAGLREDLQDIRVVLQQQPKAAVFNTLTSSLSDVVGHLADIKQVPQQNERVLNRNADQLATRLEEQMAQLRQAVDQKQGDAQLSRLETRLHELDSKLDTFAQNANQADDVALTKLEQQLAALQTSIHEGIDTSPLKSLENRLAAIADQVEGMSQPQAMDARAYDQLDAHMARMNETLDARVNAIADRVKALDAPKVDTSMLNQLDGQITRLTDMLATPQANPDLSSLDQRMQSILQHLETPRADEEARAEITSLRKDLEHLRKDLSAVPHSAQELERQISLLAERLEETQRAPHNPEALDLLEEQMTKLTDLMMRKGSADLERLEGNLAEIEKHLAQSDGQAMQAAKEAAREAAREAAEQIINRTGDTPAGDHPLIASLQDSLRELHANNNQSDQRTQETLGAVHETMQKIVSRLTMLEKDVSGFREHKQGQMTASAPAAMQAAMQAPSGLAAPQPHGTTDQHAPGQQAAALNKDASERPPAPMPKARPIGATAASQQPKQAQPNTPQPSPAAAGLPGAAAGMDTPIPPNAKRPQGLEAQSGQPTSAPKIDPADLANDAPIPPSSAAQQRAARSGAAPQVQTPSSFFTDETGADAPISPGSGMPDLSAIREKLKAEANRMEQDTASAGGDIKTNFIAAARRAAQAAAAETASNQPLPGDENPVSLDDLDEAPRSGPLGRLTKSLKGGRRPLLLAAGAVALALGAYQLNNALNSDPGVQLANGPDATKLSGTEAGGQSGTPASAQGQQGQTGGGTVPLAQQNTTPEQTQPAATGGQLAADNANGGSAVRTVKPTEPVKVDQTIMAKPVQENAGSLLSPKPTGADPFGKKPAAFGAQPLTTTPQVTTTPQAGDTVPTAPKLAELPKTPVMPALPNQAKPAQQASLPGATLPNAGTPAATPNAEPTLRAIGPKALQDDARAGDQVAQFEMARRLTEAQGTPKDLKLAAKWYEKAAASGLAPAQFRLASFYEKGQGLKQDTQLAKLWYERAANQGNTKAMHNLAVLFAEGGLGKPDMSLAAQWFKKAADHGMKDSQFNLGILYAKGLGAPQNLSESYKWFALAANQGDRDAAQKRDEVANLLDQQKLLAARLSVQTWQKQKADASANIVTIPADKWENTLPKQPNIVLNAKAMVAETQRLLTALGYQPGPADGMMGPKTRQAIQLFQKRSGLPANGKVNMDLIKALKTRSI